MYWALVGQLIVSGKPGGRCLQYEDRGAYLENTGYLAFTELFDMCSISLVHCDRDSYCLADGC